MRVLASDEVRQIESEAASRVDTPASLLVQRAGYAVAQFCLAHFKFRSVCVVCGNGAKGERGIAAAQALRTAADVSVIILAKEASELSPDAAAMYSHMDCQPFWVSDRAGFNTETIQEALSADLIVDAIAGSEFDLPLAGITMEAAEAINAATATVVSIDVPSGIDGDSRTASHQTNATAVFAHGVVTFIAPKPAHVFADVTTGPIAVSEIGLQPALSAKTTEWNVTTGQEVGIAFPPRRANAHKGDFGHVLVIGGSMGKSGAVGLAGLAALRAGAALVTVACPKSVQAIVAGLAPELMTEGLAETEDGTISTAAGTRVDALLAGKNVIVLGPGLSTNHETAQFIRELVARCTLPLVLDADGLNAFAGHFGALNSDRSRWLVLTPHPGEAARLLQLSTPEIQADRQGMARRMARETGACVVLKGWKTLIAEPTGETWINMTGGPALAKGGSGDVLSGIIGAAMARHESNESSFPKELAVVAAVYLHGLAGDLARDVLHENTVLASDLLDVLSEAFRDCEQQTARDLFYVRK
jgi:NAD(P)H-hydrate epimerase